ncbi:conjugal transfer protein TraF [Granulosicoccus sp. 3-233]|uniref:conjugal transfer protein TraF n=1 Tax=Granulosicoccus sp. 3-233 TaxID=3417969 RepID=UPI003D349DA3
MSRPICNKTTAGMCSVALSALLCTPAMAGDARSIALGGSVIANGQGVHGAVENPASLMAMKRRDERFHFRIGFAMELRDTGDAIDVLTEDENEDLIDDIETEIDILSQSQVQCDPIFGDGSDVCVGGTQAVADLSGRLLDILDTVDDETIDGQASFDMGVAFTGKAWPMAVNLKFSGTASGTPDIADGDRGYIAEFQDLLGDDVLTLDEARNSQFLEANALGATLEVQQPEDVLRSQAQGAALARAQLGISFARSFNVGNYVVDAGITPKISSLVAYDVAIRVEEEFDDASESIQDRLDDSEVTESSFTFDAGASTVLPGLPVRVAAVLRNVIPESVKTENDFEFETTPQLVIGALYQKGMLSVSGDLALNESKVDNFETQKIGVGVEFGTRKFAIRGGLSSDQSRDEDATSVSLGFGLGPLQVGARLTGMESLEAGAQIAYSF